MSESYVSDETKLPMYWDRINEEDKEAYLQLRKFLSSPGFKNRRNKSIATFKQIIDTIRQYIEKGDGRDNDRALVCGIIWIPDGIAINTHQLHLLIDKCKSSINGSFQAMNYGTNPTASDSAGQIITKFPFLKDNFPELRQWTVRTLMSPSQQLKVTNPAKNQVTKLHKVAYITPPPSNLCQTEQFGLNAIQNPTSCPPQPTISEFDFDQKSDFMYSISENERVDDHMFADDFDSLWPNFSFD